MVGKAWEKIPNQREFKSPSLLSFFFSLPLRSASRMSDHATMFYKFVWIRIDPLLRQWKREELETAVSPLVLDRQNDFAIIARRCLSETHGCLLYLSGPFITGQIPLFPGVLSNIAPSTTFWLREISATPGWRLFTPFFFTLLLRTRAQMRKCFHQKNLNLRNFQK